MMRKRQVLPLLHPRTLRPQGGERVQAQPRLVGGGADLVVVQRRLGHKSLKTTERYLDTLPNAGQQALDALRKTMGAA